MNPRQSGTRLKTNAAPYYNLQQFQVAILANSYVDLIAFSDQICPIGFVAVYLKCKKTESGFGGGTLITSAFDELRKWIKEDPRMQGRYITFSGHLSRINKMNAL